MFFIFLLADGILQKHIQDLGVRLQGQVQIFIKSCHGREAPKMFNLLHEIVKKDVELTNIRGK